MSDLLPPNATPLERAIDGASARLDELEVPLRHLWNPRLCQLAALPWLAWSLGVETWDPDWPEEVKRAAMAESIAIHREKGTPAAIKRVMGVIGADYIYTEEPSGTPMTAQVAILNSAAIAISDVAGLKAALDRVKRASLHLSLVVQSGLSASVEVSAGIGLLQVVDFGEIEGAA